MLTNKDNKNRAEKCASAARVEAVLARLSREDSKLGDRMLNAAVAGAVVARQPADTILRAEAAEAWNSIKTVIEHHLNSEEDVVLPWAESLENFPPDLILRAREQRTRLCCLARTVDATSFITGSNEEVRKGRHRADGVRGMSGRSDRRRRARFVSNDPAEPVRGIERRRRVRC